MMHRLKGAGRVAHQPYFLCFALLPCRQFAAAMPVTVNRAPVLTLWAAVVAEQLGHPTDTALTLGRSVAGSAARVKARSIGREERNADRDADTPRLREEHFTAPVLLLGKTIRLLPTADGELRAADGDQPADHTAVERYLAKAFGDPSPIWWRRIQVVVATP